MMVIKLCKMRSCTSTGITQAAAYLTAKFSLQIVRYETVREVPSHHPLLGAGDEGARARLPRAVFLLRRLPLTPNQRRPLRHEGRRRPLQATL